MIKIYIHLKNIFIKYSKIHTYIKCEKDISRNYMIKKFLSNFSYYDYYLCKIACDICFSNRTSPYKVLIITDYDYKKVNYKLIEIIRALPDYFFGSVNNRFIKTNKKVIQLENGVIIYFVNSGNELWTNSLCGISGLTHVYVDEEIYSDKHEQLVYSVMARTTYECKIKNINNKNGKIQRNLWRFN